VLTGLSHRIAVVGAGPIGSALAGHLILAIPNAAVAPLAEVYRDRLAGAVIIDPSNPFLWHDDGVMTIKDAPYQENRRYPCTRRDARERVGFYAPGSPRLPPRSRYRRCPPPRWPTPPTITRSHDGGVAQLGEDLLQQQRRRRQRNRPLRRLPTQWPISLGLVTRPMTNSGNLAAATKLARPLTLTSIPTSPISSTRKTFTGSATRRNQRRD
jgi:hypothetical protein